MGRPRKRSLINQREIVREYSGFTTKQILRWAASPKSEFPRPVKVVGVTRLFDRAEVERFFGCQGAGRQAAGDQAGLIPAS